ncbi:hypothetical protein ACFVMC_17325 [Nocardia sp. NPDC127579]|uniref:hypothetical protein n=1 Tax=Nocardia sp. NPDC127579 TaxID=3345402 RepID=UPI00363A0282
MSAAARLLVGTFTAATILTLTLPVATAAPSDTCTTLNRALHRAERDLSAADTVAERSVLETRIRDLESRLRDNNC